MRTACNFEVQLIALRAQVAGLVQSAMMGGIHPNEHTANLLASSGATFVAVLDQLVAEHRHIAHGEAGEEHGEAVQSHAILLAEQLDNAREAFFHHEGSLDSEPGQSDDDDTVGPSGPTIDGL